MVGVHRLLSMNENRNKCIFPAATLPCLQNMITSTDLKLVSKAMGKQSVLLSVLLPQLQNAASQRDATVITRHLFNLLGFIRRSQNRRKRNTHTHGKLKLKHTTNKPKLS